MQRIWQRSSGQRNVIQCNVKGSAFIILIFTFLEFLYLQIPPSLPGGLSRMTDNPEYNPCVRSTGRTFLMTWGPGVWASFHTRIGTTCSSVGIKRYIIIHINQHIQHLDLNSYAGWVLHLAGPELPILSWSYKK